MVANTGPRAIINNQGVSQLDIQHHVVLSLSSHGEGGYIIADGIKLVPATIVTPPPPQVAGLFYVHNDHLGTPQAVTDKDQNIVWQAHYSPFGKATVITEAVTNNIHFPGQYYDAETGLHYNYFRYYDPTLGRYITSDPIGLDGGINTYAYVDGNPLSYTDPYGLSKFDKFYGLPKKFWQWYHRNEKRDGDPDLTKEEADDLYKEWKDGGEKGPDSDFDLKGWFIPPAVELACAVDPCNKICIDFGYECDMYPNCEI